MSNNQNAGNQWGVLTRPVLSLVYHRLWYFLSNPSPPYLHVFYIWGLYLWHMIFMHQVSPRRSLSEDVWKRTALTRPFAASMIHIDCHYHYIVLILVACVAPSCTATSLNAFQTTMTMTSLERPGKYNSSAQTDKILAFMSHDVDCHFQPSWNWKLASKLSYQCYHSLNPPLMTSLRWNSSH